MDGENLIEVVARRPNGASVSRQLRVTKTGGSMFSVSAIPSAGMAPFDAMFQISQHGPGEISRTTIDLDGDGDVDIVRDNDDTYITGRYTGAGVFDALVTITTADGQLSAHTVPITVQDHAQVNAQVQRTWNELRAAFQAGDAEAALRLFEPESVEAYRVLLTAPGMDLTVLAQDLGQITPSKLGSSFAEYIIVRNAGGVDTAYVISFMRTADGVWRLSAL
jgi:hypothetical protein